MTELLTAAEMRAIEQAAIDSGEVTGLELMERAGAGVVDAIFEWRPELAESERRAVVLCGPGNNGGDGFVVARLLKQRGWTVDVCFGGDEERLSDDAAQMCRRWRQMLNSGTRPLTAATISELEVEPWEPEHRGCDVIVDAVFGGGLSREISEEGDIGQALSVICGDHNQRLPVVVSIDSPSGLCVDSGRVLGSEEVCSYSGATPFASLVVTFHALRLGHILEDGPTYCGHIIVKDIGLRETAFKLRLQAVFDPLSNVNLVSLEADKWSQIFPLSCEDQIHKYSHGHALIVSGGMAKTGAARLAARGALRIGAGLVTIASPPSALIENAAHLTAIMLQKMKGAEGLAEILTDGRINVVVIGPGCGVGEETRALVETTLSPARTGDLAPSMAASPDQGPGSRPGQRASRTIVLDADALTSFTNDPHALFTAIAASPCAVILTPHGGEFGRLFPDIADKLSETPTRGPAYSKVDATRDAAARSGATVLYKGADTVIAAPDGSASIAAAIYERAAPWLATAGSGDVLAGMIAGLAARGVHDPAATAAWLHQECGRHLGPGLIAEDIPEAIPAVLQRLLGWEAPHATSGVSRTPHTPESA